MFVAHLIPLSSPQINHKETLQTLRVGWVTGHTNYGAMRIEIKTKKAA